MSEAIRDTRILLKPVKLALRWLANDQMRGELNDIAAVEMFMRHG
jgi:hypothetical protein